MTVRKSKALRLTQTQALLQTYITTPLLQQFFSWDFRFLTDIEFKLRMGKKISRRQRNILDEKIAEGPKQIPAIKNNPLLDRLQLALEVLEPHHATHHFALRVGRDIAVKMMKGVNPSEKQTKMIEGFIQSAEEIKLAQPLSGERLNRAHVILDASSCYTENYWYTHSAANRAINALRAAVQSNLPITDESIASAEYAVRGTLKKIDNPKFNEGDKCKVKLYTASPPSGAMKWNKHFGIIISGPFIGGGAVCYDVLVNGELLTKAVSVITKR